MSQALDLVRAILAEQCTDDDEALAILDSALALEVDPLDFFAHRYSLGKPLVMERAADWIGLAYSPVIPETESRPRYGRLDSLADVRFLRHRLFDRDVAYSAPRFDGLLGLRAQLQDHPDLRRRLCLVPDTAIRARLAEASQQALIDEARQRLARRWPYASGHLDLSLPVRIGFVLLLLGAVVLAALAPFVFKPLLLPPLVVLLVLPAMLRIWAAIAPPPKPEAVPSLSEAELPVYSVLIPLRDEANMVPLLHKAMTALDYPPEKLDIKFIVESRSRETVEAVRNLLADPRFELVIVPDALPHTKPKALNYALPFVRGRHVVIYDAEDIPDPGQLRLAASRFAADPGVDCLQAGLVLDNASENLLTALFAGEYAGLFGLLLPLLGRWRLPMPLGGTSNHFRSSALREVGGWDAFNVTEDADLGLRLARLRYRASTLASRTREEAPITLRAFMAQRTRWMKGWMQTFIVHNRSPRRLLGDIGWRGFLFFEVYIGGLILSALLHTVFLGSVAFRLITGAGLLPSDIWDVAFLLVLVIGYGGALVLTFAGLVRLGETRLLAHQLLLPGYWVLHTIATLRAAHELLTRPYFWAKTAHGQTRVRRQ